jgi:hypothetical protein
MRKRVIRWLRCAELSPNSKRSMETNPRKNPIPNPERIEKTASCGLTGNDRHILGRHAVWETLKPAHKPETVKEEKTIACIVKPHKYSARTGAGETRK